MAFLNSAQGSVPVVAIESMGQAKSSLSWCVHRMPGAVPVLETIAFLMRLLQSSGRAIRMPAGRVDAAIFEVFVRRVLLPDFAHIRRPWLQGLSRSRHGEHKQRRDHMRFHASTAFNPPKANEFEMAYSTSAFRGQFGT